MVVAALAVLPVGVAFGQTPDSKKIADGTEPAWSPDGQWILISVLMDEQRDLYAIRPDGSERRQITDTSESELLATWSADGRVAYVKATNNRLRLFVIDNPLGGAGQPREIRLTGYAPSFTSAPWTPDAMALTVVTGEYPELEIYRVPLDGSPPISLVANPGYDGSPAWSKDGRLAFVSDRTGDRDIWVRNQDGTLHQLTTASATDDSPAWSPDGRWLAFVSNRSGNNEIHVVPAEGGAAIQITDGGAERAGYPAWSPDGSTLAYVIVTRGRGNDQLITVAVPEDLQGQR